MNADEDRLNGVIALLEASRPVFGVMVPTVAASPIGTRGVTAELGAGEGRYDFVVFDMEHQWFDLGGLAIALQFLLDRRSIAAKGSIRPDVVPLVRIPANGGERNQWIIKQALDAGVYGIVVPQVETVADARAAVEACRYPSAEGGVAQISGRRGRWSLSAPGYWGLTAQEYRERADLWPLNQRGELLLVVLIETARGVRALPRILEDVPGIGAVWVGLGDLELSLAAEPAMAGSVADAAARVLDVCTERGVPVAVIAGPDDVVHRLDAGYRMILTSPRVVDLGNELGRAHVGRRDLRR
jgi:4-hydroxy-2-oxoheptanedioate aldolase